MGNGMYQLNFATVDGNNEQSFGPCPKDYDYVSQITLRYIVCHRVLFLATPVCYILLERVFDVD